MSSTGQSASFTPGGKTSRPHIQAAVRRATTVSRGRTLLKAAARVAREASLSGTRWTPGPTGTIPSPGVRFQVRVKPFMGRWCPPGRLRQARLRECG